jgi:phenylacetate-CoA ligase
MIPLPLRVRALFALLNARSRGAFGQEFRVIERTQWDPPDRVRELQFQRLKALVLHAEQYVPFYARRFAEVGVTASDLRTPEDLRRFPLLDKKDLIAAPDALLSAATRRSNVVRKATGGSTGQRVTFYRDAAAMARNFAHVLRNYMWAGLELGELHAFLWGAHFDLQMQQRASNRLINYCLRQKWLDAFHMNASAMAAYAKRLEQWKPQLLSCYVTAAVTLADFIGEAGLPRLAIPAVATTAETLFPENRTRIQQAFGAEVFDRLGCREIGNTAHECSAHDGLHVNAEHVVVEVLDAAGHAAAPGVEGELVYTSLGNDVFPLIRYRVGDYAVAAADRICSCGRGLPKIAAVRGRITDMLVAPDGTKIHGEFFSHLFYKASAIREFRVLQETLDRVLVWVVPITPGHVPQDQLGMLDLAFRQVFGRTVELQISIVDAIPRPESGKHRFTESRVTVPAR